MNLYYWEGDFPGSGGLWVYADSEEAAREAAKKWVGNLWHYQRFHERLDDKPVLVSESEAVVIPDNDYEW